jgi:putative endonuclease
MNNKVRGTIGELLACLLLKMKFYKIVARNYRSKYGEIDIIASKKDIIVFLEVKVRTKIDQFDQPVHYTQSDRIKRLAELYLLKYNKCNKYFNIRFDLIIIRSLYKVEHYQNVW